MSQFNHYRVEKDVNMWDRHCSRSNNVAVLFLFVLVLSFFLSLFQRSHQHSFQRSLNTRSNARSTPVTTLGLTQHSYIQYCRSYMSKMWVLVRPAGIKGRPTRYHILFHFNLSETMLRQKTKAREQICANMPVSKKHILLNRSKIQ